MDIDTFINELEKVCDCPNQGYIKCLEKVKELKEEKPPKDLYECRQRLEKHRKALSKLLKIEDTFKHQELMKVLNKKD